MSKILLVGATGYLGTYILRELLIQGFDTKIIVRNENKIAKSLKEHQNLEIIKAEITDSASLAGSCKDIDVLISTLGITKQKDGLTYMDVDYQANLNLLHEAKKQGVKKFLYISVLNGEKLKQLAICNAKEKFVDALKNSGLEYCIIRPNGFFSDMAEFYKMAKSGRIYLFGSGKPKNGKPKNGQLRANPIHGEDLAKECVRQINASKTELKIGGPETLTQNEIAHIAFEVINKKPKIIYIPNWVRLLILKFGKLCMPQFKYGPLEFFMSVVSMEMVAPEYGTHTLKEYFQELNTIQGN